MHRIVIAGSLRTTQPLLPATFRCNRLIHPTSDLLEPPDHTSWTETDPVQTLHHGFIKVSCFNPYRRAIQHRGARHRLAEYPTSSAACQSLELRGTRRKQCKADPNGGSPRRSSPAWRS